MEFSHSERQLQLKKEVHEFCVREVPSDYPSELVLTPESKEINEFWWEFQGKCLKNGYAIASWPKKYGGLGYNAMEQAAVSEEFDYFGTRWPGSIGLTELSPVVMVVGTDEQKDRFIPPLVQNKDYWAQCLTEPDAGSDEANVKLKAVRDGDFYILNGQKMFISLTAKPTWLYTLCRTTDSDPPHRGLSIFIVRTDSPGITMRPLPTMGGSMQSEIFYEDVKVPKENLIGQLNRGFYHAMATFEFERGHVGTDYKRGLEAWVDFCRNETRNGKPLIEDPECRAMLAKMCMEKGIMWLSGWYAAWRKEKRDELGPSPYDISATFRKDRAIFNARQKMDLFGLYGQLRPESDHTKMEGQVQRSWERLGGLHSAGTVEIYKMVLAARGLGLPRVPRSFNKSINEAIQKTG